MKQLPVCALVFFFAGVAQGAMSRVVEIRDSRTIVVVRDGVLETIVLSKVHIAPQEEETATAFLRETLANAWVYIEGADVYRSPDALYVNDAMRRRAWLGFTYLGELRDIGMPAKTATKAPPPDAPKKRASPPKRSKRPVSVARRP